MLTKHTSRLNSSALEDNTRTACFSPFPAVALCSRVNYLLEQPLLSTNLQRLEVTDYDDEYQAQYVVVVLELRGLLNVDLLKRQFNLLIRNYDRDQQMHSLDGQWMSDPLEASPLSLIHITQLSLVEQRAAIFQWTSENAQNRQACTSITQMYTYVLRLHMDMHLLLMNLWQRTPTAHTSTMLMQDLFSIFFAGKHKSTATGLTYPDQDVDKGAVLTRRELEVLHYVSAGCSNREIADRCCIAEGTVKRHLNNIYIKLDANSRTQAIACAQSLNLLAPISQEEE